MKETFFSPADILLPPYTPDDPAWCKWSVIACDQFTSEKQYWDSVAKITEGAPSAYSLILPEAYLGSEAEEVHKKTIAASMDTVGTFLKKYENVMVYVERTLEGAGVRRGLVGKLDLEKYDYSASSISPVRATEATVLERIPPRCRIRASSPFELPHVMVFADDKGGIISSLASRKNEMKKLYDFDLMLGGGHITAYLVDGEILRALLCNIADYEAEKSGSVVYAMGKVRKLVRRNIPCRVCGRRRQPLPCRGKGALGECPCIRLPRGEIRTLRDRGHLRAFNRIRADLPHCEELQCSRFPFGARSALR